MFFVFPKYKYLSGKKTLMKIIKKCFNLKIWVGTGREPPRHWLPASVMYLNPVPVYSHLLWARSVGDIGRKQVTGMEYWKKWFDWIQFGNWLKFICIWNALCNLFSWGCLLSSVSTLCSWGWGLPTGPGRAGEGPARSHRPARPSVTLHRSAPIVPRSLLLWEGASPPTVVMA